VTGTEPRREQPGDPTSWYETPWYVQPGYTVYPYPPYHPTPPDDRTRTLALASLGSNIAISAVCCPPLGIAGVVLSAIALRRCERDPVSARRLVAWSWVALAVSLVAGLVAVAVFVAVGAGDSP
jgi:hypothetical protein